MRVIAIIGPTAVGKSALGVAMAQKLGGEVISGDSRQVYRGLNLGTGKVTTEEMDGVQHHLIDVADPTTQYTVNDFVRVGRSALQDITARGKVPIVVGGTGLYIDALLGRVSLDAPPVDTELRTRLSLLSDETLKEELRKVDPKSYARVDLKNRRRVQRALEIALTNSTKTVEQTGIIYDIGWIGLTLPRELLKAKIHARLVARLEAGMLNEARQLHVGGLSYERMEALGLEYRYMARHLEGQITYDEMVQQLDSEIYKYAKRQITWFKRNKDIQWFDANELPPIDTLVRLLSLQ